MPSYLSFSCLLLVQFVTAQWNYQNYGQAGWGEGFTSSDCCIEFPVYKTKNSSLANAPPRERIAAMERTNMYGSGKSKKIWQCREAASGLYSEGAEALCFNTEEYPCLNYCAQVMKDGFKNTWIKVTTNNLTNLGLTDRSYRHLLPAYTKPAQQRYADPLTWQSASGETHQPGIDHKPPGPYAGIYPSWSVGGNSYHTDPIILDGFKDSSQRTVRGTGFENHVYARDPSRTTSYGKTETGYIDALKKEDGSTGFDGKKEATLVSPHGYDAGFGFHNNRYNNDNHGNVLRIDVDAESSKLSGASAGADEIIQTTDRTKSRGQYT